MAKKVYTVPIDKELCKEFLMKPMSEITEAHIAEVRKVFNVIIRNYYADMKYDEEELFRENLVKILETRSKYDPGFCAYNYIYTGLRFSIGNERVARKRIISTDQPLPDRETVTWERDDREDALLEILSGFYEVVELEPTQVFNLLFLDSDIQEQTAENLVVFISKLSKNMVSTPDTQIQILTINDKQVRRILFNGLKLYIVKDLWSSLESNYTFHYKHMAIPCITEQGLYLEGLVRQNHRAFIKRLIKL